jgi:hypothetical protein
VGERHLPGLKGRCHGFRRPNMSLRGRRLLGVVCPPWRIHFFRRFFYSEEASNKEDQRASMVVDIVWVIEVLRGWETKLLPTSFGVW